MDTSLILMIFIRYISIILNSMMKPLG